MTFEKRDSRGAPLPPPSPLPAPPSSWTSRFYELFIALRMLRSRGRAFLSVVGFISMLGVVLGVVALTVIMSVSGGFQASIQTKILGFYPDLVVMKRSGDFRDYREVAAEIREVPEVVGVSPATYDEMMLANGDRRAGVVVKGVDLPTVRSVSALESFLDDNADLDELDERPSVSRPTPDRVVLSGIVAGTAATALILPDGSTTSIEDDPTEPEMGRARLRLLHALPNVPDARLTLDGASPEDTAQTVLGGASPYVDLDPGLRSLELRPATGGAPLASLDADIREDHRYTVLAAPGPTGAPTLTLLEDSYLKPEGELAQARLVNASAASGVQVQLVDHTGGELAGPVAPMAAGAYAPTAGALPGVFIARDLAHRLLAERGDVVTLVTPLRGLGNRSLAPFGMAPTAARFRVLGTFHVGYYEYDTRFVVVAFRAAQRFLNRGDIPRWLEVRTRDALLVDDQALAVKSTVDPYDIGMFLDHVHATVATIREVVAGRVPGHELSEPETLLDLIGNHSAVLGLLRFQDQSFGYRERFRIITWKETYRYLFSSLKLQKVVLSMFFLIIVLVASFNIIGSQVMVVHEKTREIAILRSMGASRGGIRRIFLIQGMVIGVMGTTLGIALGWVACVLLDWSNYGLDPKVYYISKLPVAMDPWEFGMTAVAALLFSFLASRYSANKAAQRTPVEGLRRLD